MRSKSTIKLVLNALFVAITFVLGMTPLGIIPLPAINVTILHIPVIVGTLFLGFKSGLLLGFVFGLCSTLSAFGLSLTPPSALAAALGSKSPLLLILMCFVPRLLVPTVTWLVHILMKKLKVNEHLSNGLAALLGSATNTVFYLSLMVLFYKLAALNVDELLSKLHVYGLSFFGIVGVVATGAGGLEALAAFVIVPAILGALSKVKKQSFRSN